VPPRFLGVLSFTVWGADDVGGLVGHHQQPNHQTGSKQSQDGDARGLEQQKQQHRSDKEDKSGSCQMLLPARGSRPGKGGRVSIKPVSAARRSRRRWNNKIGLPSKNASPAKADKPPSGSNWIHEIKHDGLRWPSCKDNAISPCRF
jgi:hypothetical protein